MGAHSAEDRDAGNTDVEELTAQFTDDELAEILARLAEEDEIRDNQRDLWRQQHPGQVGPAGGYDSGGLLPPGNSLAFNGTGEDERIAPPAGAS